MYVCVRMCVCVPSGSPPLPGPLPFSAVHAPAGVVVDKASCDCIFLGACADADVSQGTEGAQGLPAEPKSVDRQQIRKLAQLGRVVLECQGLRPMAYRTARAAQVRAEANQRSIVEHSEYTAWCPQLTRRIWQNPEPGKLWKGLALQKRLGKERALCLGHKSPGGLVRPGPTW